MDGDRRGFSRGKGLARNLYGSWIFHPVLHTLPNLDHPTLRFKTDVETSTEKVRGRSFPQPGRALIETAGNLSLEQGSSLQNVRELWGGLERLALRAFRNYSEAEVEFDRGLNVLHGSNAQGKTNLLEAVHLLATSRLLRGQRESEAIREGESGTEVQGVLYGSQSVLGISLERGARKRASLNGVGLPRASDLLGRMPCVCVSALDLETIRGEPSERRLFLDLQLSALYPAYLRHLAAYRKALEQRNALLKQAREEAIPGAAFEVWEAALAEHGAAIRRYRLQYVELLRPEVARLQAQMGQGEALETSLATDEAKADSGALEALLARNRGADVGRGATSTGPHRDDLELSVGGRSARLFGSQGQQRTAAISLKLASLGIAREVLGLEPVLLLDDIFSDLDHRRRDILVEIVLERSGQAILTCTEPDTAGKRILERSRRFRVSAGTVTPE